MKELDFFTNWSDAHPTSIELAAKIAELAPGDLNRVFFTSGGCEAVDSALKLVRQYHKLTGNPLQDEDDRRETAYHGTTMGALSHHRHHGRAPAVRAARARRLPRRRTNLYRLPHGFRPRTSPRRSATGSSSRARRPSPPSSSSPCRTPAAASSPPEGYFPRVREICDEFDVLLVSDEVICSWGRLGTWFGCERIGYQPDLITTAKGLTSSYAPMGAVIASDRVAEPFVEGTRCSATASRSAGTRWPPRSR